MSRVVTSVIGVATVVVLGLAGCGTAGLYGHSRTYTPLQGEQAAVGNARQYDPVMAARRVEEWRSEPVQLFAVVTARQAGHDGYTSLQVSMRQAADRNLCADESSESCRMTVTAKGFAELTVLVKLSGEDERGPRKVDVGSLLRVVGHLVATDEGERTTLRADWYRHWPSDEYVTTKARRHMRR